MKYLTSDFPVLQSPKHQSSVNVYLIGYPPAPAQAVEFVYLSYEMCVYLLGQGWQFENPHATDPEVRYICLSERASTPADGNGAADSEGGAK